MTKVTIKKGDLELCIESDGDVADLVKAVTEALVTSGEVATPWPYTFKFNSAFTEQQLEDFSITWQTTIPNCS